jgi:hypothetical protein
MCTCKCRKETPRPAVLNKNALKRKNKSGDQESNTGPVWGLLPVGRENI